MHLSTKLRRAKLATLVEIEGYSSLNDLLRVSVMDGVCPSICISESCSYTCEMEPDQDRGWCEECNANTVQSALVLAGVI